MVDLHDDPKVRHQEQHIIEHHVVGFPFNSTDGMPATQFAMEAMPLLIAGFITTKTDTRGTLGWRLTDSGRRALELGPPEPDQPFEEDDQLSREYDAVVREVLDQRNEWKPSQAGELGIPMSAGLWLTTSEWAEYRERRAGAKVDG